MDVDCDQVRQALRILLQRLIDLRRDEQWASYARAWLDGSMMQGQFDDPVMSRKATPMDFVRDSQAGACAASGKKKPGNYEFARALEDAAWAVVFFESGELSKATKFMAQAGRGAGLAVEGSVL